MKMKYLEQIIDSQAMVIQDTTNANESEFGELQQDKSRKPDSKIAEVEGGILVNMDPGEKNGTMLVENLNLAETDSSGTEAELKEKSLLKDICESCETIDEYRNPVANLLLLLRCPRQPGSTEWGYFTLKFMKEVVKHGVQPLENDTIGGDSNEYTDADIDDIREKWEIYVSNFIFR